MLRCDGFRAATLANLFLFVLDLRQKVNDAAVVFLEVGRLRLYVGFQNGSGHSQTSRRDSHRRAETPSRAEANSIRSGVEIREHARRGVC